MSEKIRRPGPRYRAAWRGTSYWKDNRDGTITAVAIVWPKNKPAWDGGEWTESEVWTVRLPLEPGDTKRMRSRAAPWRRRWLGVGPVYMLADKPHRLTWWDADHPQRQILERRTLTAKEKGYG